MFEYCPLISAPAAVSATHPLFAFRNSPLLCFLLSMRLTLVIFFLLGHSILRVRRWCEPHWHLFDVFCLYLVAATLGYAADAPITQEELVRRTQELYEAVAPGNRAPWQKYFADDCIFSDEKGRTLDKPRLVADIAPLPVGYSGAIKIDKVQSRIIGDTAVLSYDANETETIFGQNLKARYHVTDTWLRRNGEWQIIASQAHRYYEDPTVGKADPKKFADFIGTYEVAPGQTRSVFGEGDKLFVERKGKKEQLLPETSELFFRKDV